MPNALQTCCPGDSCDINTREKACIYCGLGICWGCDSRLPPDELHFVAWVPGEGAPGPLCIGCVAGEQDSDGVPEEVDDESSGAQTVETPTLTDQQLLALLDTMVECREAA